MTKNKTKAKTPKVVSEKECVKKMKEVGTASGQKWVKARAKLQEISEVECVKKMKELGATSGSQKWDKIRKLRG